MFFSCAASMPSINCWMMGSASQLSNLINTSKNIDLAPDGKRFAVILLVGQPGSQPARSRVTLIENFFD
jgi:hypothetical protein